MRSPIAPRRASYLPSPLTIPMKQVSQLTRENQASQSWQTAIALSCPS
ncbi:MAG: hypothetical protein HWQ38_11470 [Nostoc sp. NMS7]|nr:hypothetical protein [Nostoc sp. NMS7]MBN3947063.1 hypothetical protein [Nostoc sp. NMS7]